MKLSIQNFSGMIPLQHPGKLPEHAAQTAENCCTESGIVRFRNTVSDWVDPESGNVSSVNQRKYAILNGILTEDGVSLHMEKPSKPSVRKIPFWTLEDGYTFKKAGVSYPKFQLSSAIGIAGTPSILDPVSVVYDDETSAFTMKFTKTGMYLPSNTQVIINMPDTANIHLLYDEQEIRLEYPNSISIPDDDNGVYATIYFEGVKFETEDPPGEGEMKISTVHTIIKGRIMQNKTRRNYVVTYWDGRHESPPSDISEDVDVCNGDHVQITMTGYTGGHGTHTPDLADNAPAFYIYRTGGSVTSAAYYFVGERSSAGTYEDNVKEHLLQEELSIIESPRTDMCHLRFFNGSLLAAKGSHVYFSESHILYHWPSAYEYSFADEVTGLTVSGNSVIVFVRNHAPCILQGSSPGALTQTTLEDIYSCVSATSICTVAGITYYASMEGLVALSASGTCKLFTLPFFSRTQWKALHPESMKCSADPFGIRLYLADGSIYIFDFTSNGTVLSKINTGSEKFIWKTKVFTFPVPVCFRLARITTADGEGLCTLSAGNKLEHTINVPCAIPNGRAFRFGTVYARQWCIEVQSSSDLLEIELATSPQEMY